MPAGCVRSSRIAHDYERVEYWDDTVVGSGYRNAVSIRGEYAIWFRWLGDVPV